jgi:hypothetical protein
MFCVTQQKEKKKKKGDGCYHMGEVEAELQTNPGIEIYDL